MLHVCGAGARRTGQRRLALAGGVALNCTANGRLLASGLFDEVYVQPAAGDDGAALGAALLRASLHGEVQNTRSPVPFFGPSYPMSAVRAALARCADRVETVEGTTLEATCDEAARLIAEGRVVAWYRGRMEVRPRALRQRSIRAEPGDPTKRDPDKA